MQRFIKEVILSKFAQFKTMAKLKLEHKLGLTKPYKSTEDAKNDGAYKTEKGS